jgi:hypothetical protein
VKTKLQKAEVKLRTAAVGFALLGPPLDQHDTIGIRANQKLMRAAIEYAKAMNDLEYRKDRQAKR